MLLQCRLSTLHTRTAYTAAVTMFARLQFACVLLGTAAAVTVGTATPAVTARSSQRNVAAAMNLSPITVIPRLTLALDNATDDGLTDEIDGTPPNIQQRR